MMGKGEKPDAKVLSGNMRKLLGRVLFALLVIALFVTMGILAKRRGEKAVSSVTVVKDTDPPAHQEDWAAYLSTIDNDKVGAIMVDLALKPLVPIASKPIRLRVDVQMNYPSENGLPMQREFVSLNEIDEMLSVTLTSKVGAVYAGHLYCQGTMSLYYYLGEGTTFETNLSEVMSAFPNYRYEYKLDREPHWNSYLEFLYPMPIQMQSIHNHKVIDNLRSKGDKLDVRRPVDHLIYFKNEADLARFLNEIKGKGFEVVSRERTELEEYRWSVLLRRDDPVDPKSVDDYVLYLWQKAQEANGDYDGWGSTIVRD